VLEEQKETKARSVIEDRVRQRLARKAAAPQPPSAATPVKPGAPLPQTPPPPAGYDTAVFRERKQLTGAAASKWIAARLAYLQYDYDNGMTLDELSVKYGSSKAPIRSALGVASPPSKGKKK